MRQRWYIVYAIAAVIGIYLGYLQVEQKRKDRAEAEARAKARIERIFSERNVRKAADTIKSLKKHHQAIDKAVGLKHSK